MRCCTHILNLIANEGLEKVYKSIISIHSVIKYVRSSIARLQAFQIYVKQEKILQLNDQISKRSVILDCLTRWNFTYTMFMTILKLKSAFDQVANEDKFYDAYFYGEGGAIRVVGEEWDLREVIIRKMLSKWSVSCGFFMMPHWHFLLL